MALSDKWTRTQIRTYCANELLDPNNKWFPVAELNLYIDEWQQRLQDWFGNEFVWATATTTVAAIGTTTNSVGALIPNGTASILLSTFLGSNVRSDAFYWVSSTNTSTATHGVRLVPRTKQDLNLLIRDWRLILPIDPPLVVYQDDITNIVLWPGPANAGTVIAEFPVLTTFATDTSTMQIPAWTKYSSAYYVAYRAYLRTGPRQDIQKSMIYKKVWEGKLKRYRWMWDNYLPERYTQLKPKQPSDRYNIDILSPANATILPPVGK